MAVLTTKNDAAFELSFKYRLSPGYTFEELSQRNLKEFQGFLNKVCKMTVTQVDHLFARKTDVNDIYNGQQVFHYGITDKFRLHVINENGSFIVIRLDPNHKFHG